MKTIYRCPHCNSPDLEVRVDARFHVERRTLRSADGVYGSDSWVHVDCLSCDGVSSGHKLVVEEVES